MSLLDDLKWLARLPRATSPFLSLYLNSRWDSEKQRERVRIFVKTRLKECVAVAASEAAAVRGHLENDVEKLSHYVNGLVRREWDESYSGVAVFACSGLGVYRVIRSHMPFVDRFECGKRPVLWPAAEHWHAGGAALVAQVSSDGGRLLAMTLGGFRKQYAFRDEDFPGRHDQGGLSQARYQRHVEDHIQRNLKRLGNQLVRWADERSDHRIFLAGPDTLVAAFEESLPKRIAGRVWGRLHVKPAAADDVLLSETLEGLRQARRQTDEATVDRVLARVAGDGPSLLGPGAVADAVASGKVRRLYLDRGFKETGWHCFRCRAMGVKIPLGCPLCGADVEGVELGEELVRETLATDGAVRVVSDHDGLLRDAGGVAATLRY